MQGVPSTAVRRTCHMYLAITIGLGQQVLKVKVQHRLTDKVDRIKFPTSWGRLDNQLSGIPLST